MPSKKILIVGQGLAGSVLAEKLIRLNYEITIIDKGHQGISSSIAAGVVNPVTGRRIVKSWLIDDLLPIAKKYYQQLGTELNINLWYDLPSLRIFTDTAMSNNWGVRMEHEGYQKYLDFAEAGQINLYPIKAPVGAGIIQGSGRANISLMIQSLRTKWLKENILQEANFHHAALDWQSNSLSYQSIFYHKIIFCEGWESMQNPLFSDLPFQVSKGEVFILKIPKMSQEKIVKRKVAFVPLGGNLFWVGATNFWEFEDCQPSKKGAAWLKTEIDAVLKSSYEIIEHKAAIRPTVRNRRPLIGFSKELEANQEADQIGIFNGFGTKGTSLVPYFADRFIDSFDSNQSWLVK